MRSEVASCVMPCVASAVFSCFLQPHLPWASVDNVMAPKAKVDVSGHASRLRTLQERKRAAVEELKALRSQTKEDTFLRVCLDAM